MDYDKIERLVARWHEGERTRAMLKEIVRCEKHEMDLIVNHLLDEEGQPVLPGSPYEDKARAFHADRVLLADDGSALVWSKDEEPGKAICVVLYEPE